MKKNFKIGVIGAGFMSSAIISGIISSKIVNKKQIICSDISGEALEKMAKKGVKTTFDNTFLVENSDFVLFAVKPQSLQNVFESIKTAPTKIISIVAGTKKEKYKKAFPNVLIARCMPNTPCSIKSGAIGVDYSDFSDKNDVDFIKSVLEPLGAIEAVNESKLNAVTGISGSSPAYFYFFAKSIIEAGVKNGLEYDACKNLVVNTMIGSGKMILSNQDKTLDELINAVCSKGGTTIEAMKVFNDKELNKIVDEAVEQCIKRAGELENL